MSEIQVNVGQMKTDVIHIKKVINNGLSHKIDSINETVHTLKAKSDESDKRRDFTDKVLIGVAVSIILMMITSFFSMAFFYHGRTDGKNTSRLQSQDSIHSKVHRPQSCPVRDIA